jgi:hypothetical protein
METNPVCGTESGWKPTPEMYHGRRDYKNLMSDFYNWSDRGQRMDDALHVTDLGSGQIEIGDPGPHCGCFVFCTT